MSKPKLVSQERMSIDVVPLPEARPQFRSFAEMFESDFVEDKWKLNWIRKVAGFETINSITKNDLHAALKWLADRTI